MSPVLKMGYVMMASWNVVMAIGSVGGCVEDGDMNETAKKILIIAFHLSKWAEVRVCGACAKFLCGGIVGCWVGEDELWNKLYEDQTRYEDKLYELFTGLQEKELMRPYINYGNKKKQSRYCRVQVPGVLC
ncbi:uncharacterized protein [Primulina huaijiensis]|uniref:uncharacterized protein isoform X2 n=1 Tax=Primulina huaijiensis TaxID=1492673 RepID=UPI003CC6EA2A